MSRIDEQLQKALALVGSKPTDSAKRSEKKAYSEKVSQVVARAIADDLRNRGLNGARPAPESTLGDSGAERRIAGGIGAKKVDITWATEESGLLLGISVKTINFRDSKTHNFQKNLINRRGDMLMEAVTLHRRFPYAVLAGLLILDINAERDSTDKRNSTFINAHRKFNLFNGRSDPADREEQYEKFYIGLLNAEEASIGLRFFEVGSPEKPITLSALIDVLLQLVVSRNPDFYEINDDFVKEIK